METFGVVMLYIGLILFGAVAIGAITKSPLGGLGGAVIGAGLALLISLISSSSSSSSSCTPSDDEKTAAGGEGVLSFIKNDSGNCIANSCVEGYTLDGGICSKAADVDPDPGATPTPTPTPTPSPTPTPTPTPTPQQTCKKTEKNYQQGARCVRPDNTIYESYTSAAGCCQTDLLSENLTWKVPA